MRALSELLDRLLRLGEQIAEAAAADDWSRVANLVERRGEMARPLDDQNEQAVDFDLSEAERAEKAQTLADQNERLTAMLQERRDAIEDELTQIGQMRKAQDSYEAPSSGGGVLPPELSG